ncbi:hypothetical protein [Cellulomonas cellasea]|uniref:Uncharacterized protein n=1 Tax=Cellulomonas cellasea TaxID=43670 RepID=A0A7W4UCR1_9CELL|nr:hypothetical protein [Cellulomonas cellasea]MBB2921692.1 hypothetical protein [Cellulomonas cellasea]
MTPRAHAPLPAEWAGPILELVEATRAAAAPSVDDDGAWATAEAGQERLRTGHKAARRTASAGQSAAHLLRFRAIEAVQHGHDEPWTLALATSTEAVGSWDWDTRMQVALDLRRTFKHLAAADDTDARRETRLVAAWLTHSDGPGLVTATGELCRAVLALAPSRADLAASWYATHGDRLLRELAARGPAVHAALVGEAVRGVDAARVLTRTHIADHAGIAREALDAHLEPGPDA